MFNLNSQGVQNRGRRIARPKIFANQCAVALACYARGTRRKSAFLQLGFQRIQRAQGMPELDSIAGESACVNLCHSHFPFNRCDAQEIPSALPAS